MEMEKYKLGEICEIFAGGDAPKNATIYKTKDNSVPIFSNGIENGGLYGFTSIAKIDKPSVTISARGTIGVPFLRKEPYFPIVRLLSVIPKEKIALHYLYYVMKLQRYKKDGSVQQQLTIPMLADITIQLPPLPEQQKIAAVLSSLDDKIALNKKINTKLEAMSKRLYDYWFVQFDFPNEEGKPYKSSGGKMVWNEVLKREIPEGWEAVQIQSILDKHPSTKRYNTSEYLHEGKYPIVDQDSSTFIAGYTNEDDELLRRFPAVLFGDHSMCVKFLNFEFCRGADGTQILYSNDDRIKPYYLYLVVKSLTIPNQGYSRHFKYLKELPVILPSLELAAKFQEIVKPIYEKKTKCDKQIEKLSRLRDRLLPLLMNGQVEVEG